MKICTFCKVENLDDAHFCDNCGKPFTVVDQGAPVLNVGAQTGVLVAVAANKTYQLQPDRELLIGRGDPSKGLSPDITLDDDAALADGVSRMHAKVFCHENKYYVSDLNSTNSTFLNKQKLESQEPYELQDGDEIQLGRYLLRLRFL